MSSFKTFFIALIVSCISFSSLAGLSVGSTRIIFHGNVKETSLNVINSDDSIVYLIRTWLSSDGELEKKTPPFVVTPPLFRIEPGQTNAVRIALTSSALPQDRESLFWMNTLAIPPATDKANSLQFSVNTRIKVLYRPTAIDVKDDVSNAFKKLTFSRQGKFIIISNTTPYYISFAEIKINGVKVQGTFTAPPKGKLKIDNAPQGNEITWKSINDYGGVTQESSASI